MRRESLGLSQQVVADRLGVRAPTVCRWEKGVIKPGDDMQRRWDSALFAEAK